MHSSPAMVALQASLTRHYESPGIKEHMQKYGQQAAGMLKMLEDWLNPEAYLSEAQAGCIMHFIIDVRVMDGNPPGLPDLMPIATYINSCRMQS